MWHPPSESETSLFTPRWQPWASPSVCMFPRRGSWLSLSPVLFLLLVCVHGLGLCVAGVWVVFLRTYLLSLKKINGV